MPLALKISRYLDGAARNPRAQGTSDACKIQRIIFGSSYYANFSRSPDSGDRYHSLSEQFCVTVLEDYLFIDRDDKVLARGQL